MVIAISFVRRFHRFYKLTNFQEMVDLVWNELGKNLSYTWEEEHSRIYSPYYS